MRYILGLGSNLGEREKYIEKAIRSLHDIPEITILKISKLIDTEPYGKMDQPTFINCALELETDLLPERMLKICQSIENKLGRIRTEKWGPRTIDIDLLLCEDKILNSDNLKIPHPEIEKRMFVLSSLVELCPNQIHPVSQKKIKVLYKELLCDR